MPASPSTDNITLPKGYFRFKRDGESDYRHMGNAASGTVTPAVERKDHYSNMEGGARVKDLSVVSQKALTLQAAFEEFTPENLGLREMGDPANTTGETYQEITIMSLDDITGSLRFVSTNTQGPRFQYDWPRVNLSPTGSMDLVPDDFGRLELTADILFDSSIGGFGIMRTPITAEVETP
jgi:hypothetical protein